MGIMIFVHICGAIFMLVGLYITHDHITTSFGIMIMLMGMIGAEVLQQISRITKNRR